MCPAAHDTLVGSMLDTFVPEATLASTLAGLSNSLKAANSLTHTTYIASVLHDAGAKTFPGVFVAPPGGAVVTGVYLLSETAVSANATNKWLADVHNPTDSVSLIAAQASTANTAVTANALWSLGAIQNGTLQENDVVTVGLTGAGSVVVLGPTTVVVKYRR